MVQLESWENWPSWCHMHQVQALVQLHVKLGNLRAGLVVHLKGSELCVDMRIAIRDVMLLLARSDRVRCL
jgi:hypothetical protein